MPTLIELETLLQVKVKRVSAVIALVVTKPWTPFVGLTLVLKPFVPVTLHDAGGLVTV
jgi:hypothetical protein